LSAFKFPGPMAEAAGIPTADDRSRYETLKKELMQALPKKRVTDRQLVRLLSFQFMDVLNMLGYDHIGSNGIADL